MLNPRKLLITSIAAVAAGISPVSYAQDDGGALEEVIVRGIRSSLERSIDIKRESSQIMEAITADDIGKMPDQNVAESLQRLPGIQIDRRDGEGTKVRIRGLHQNLTLLNGETFTSGMEYYQLGEWKQEYSGSMEAVPSELLGGVEVYKSPKANLVEGGIGGTINLKTRSALDLDDLLLAATVKVDSGVDSADAQPSAFFVIGNNFNDRFGAIFSVASTKKTVQTDYIQNFSRENTAVRCTGGGAWDSEALECSTGQSYIAPGMFYVMDTEQERERLGMSLNMEFRATDALAFTADFFHNELDITNVQYTVKHPMNTDNAAGIDESLAYSIDSSHAVGVLRSGTITLPDTETNTAGEKAEISADNYSVGMKFDDGGSIRFSAKIQGSSSDLDSSAGYADSRFSPYSFRRFTDNGTTGWEGLPVNAGPTGSARSYTYSAGEKPNLNYTNSAWLSDPDYHTYKSHWALGSDVKTETSSIRFDMEHDINFKDLKTMSYGVRLADEEVEFNELRWLTDFSTTTGAQTPRPIAADGTIDYSGDVTPGNRFDMTLAPDATNAGIQEAVYYDLCGNGGIPQGNICDLNGDGFDDNQPFGPNGYFHDAAIGSKVFDFNERMYSLDVNGDPTAGYAAWTGAVVTYDDDGDEVTLPDGTIDPANHYEYSSTSPDAELIVVAGAPTARIPVVEVGADGISRNYRERPLAVSLWGDDFATGSRWGNSPGYLPWQTYTAQAGVIGATGDASRYIRVTDFFPSGGYSNNNIVFQNGERIAADPAGWMQNVIAPNSQGRWHQVPLESWKVKQSTTALYAMADFEGDTVPYTLNVGLRVVDTEVDVTSSATTAESANWSLASDGWNSQGVLLTWITSTKTTDYIDVLPSLNFALDTSDSTKLRITAAKVINRPNLQDLGKGLSLNFTRVDTPYTYYGFTGGTGGNPELEPYRATQADIAYEWYFDDLGLMSVGIFTKAVEAFIANRTVSEFRADDGPGGGRSGGITRPYNGAGGSVNGLEVMFQKSWENGFGGQFNYTYSDSAADIFTTTNPNVGLMGISKNAFNLMGFFENEILSARLAYTWRDEFLSPDRSSFDVNGLENGASEFFNDYGQWDASVTWDVLENLSVSFEALNITGEASSSYLAYPNQPMTYTSQEPRYVLGVSFRL